MIQTKTKRITLVAMMAALAYVVMFAGKMFLVGAFSFVPQAPFLQYDPKDIVIVIAAFLIGPWYGVIISILVSVLEMITISDSGPIGMLMNIISTCFFTTPAALIYKKMKSMKGAVIGLTTGVVSMTVAMILWNYLITPLYMGIDREVVASMLLSVFAPFNLIKASINMAVTLIFYKPVVRVLRRAGLVEASANQTTEGKTSKVPSWVIGGVLLVICVVVVLFMKGII